MNLIQHFPDVSPQIRNRVKWNKIRRHGTRMSMSHLKDNDPELALVYNKEFKKWDYKLTLIVALGIASLYAVVFTASGIFQWVKMNRNL
jgi:hypothetical protein